MKVIYKYEFDITGTFSLRMPLGGRILHVECQGRQPCLWALVDPGQEAVDWDFRVYGTGDPIDEAKAGEHVATFQQGPFVWHLFLISRPWDG